LSQAQRHDEQETREAGEPSPQGFQIVAVAIVLRPEVTCQETEAYDQPKGAKKPIEQRPLEGPTLLILFTLSGPDEDLEGTLSILEGVRLAGSYKQYVLQDYKYLLRIRSLLARDSRALIGPRNPDVVARLFGGSFDAWATFPHQRLAGVPDPAFWLVMEYWRLGDWRRPRA